MSSSMGWILPMLVVSRWWCVLFIVAINRPVVIASNDYRPPNLYSAFVNITYRDPKTGEMATERAEIGRYGTSSRRDPEWGWVVHIRSANNKTDGCQPPVNVPSVRWVALIQRGSCKFHEKIYNAAIVKNASAVVIYNNKEEAELLTMEHKVDDVVSIFISHSDGLHIAQLVDNGTYVRMYITFGKQQMSRYPSINKTSVLFVSISFIVLMIISLAWLIFYYIQRFRYAHAKERLSKRLMHAAKKAVGKMPVRTVKHGDKETDPDFDQCAICIEGYKASEQIRIMPCKHEFHKWCVDPWLMEHRSCPICKLDILKAYGLQLHGSRDSMANVEAEGVSTSIWPSELATQEAIREIEQESDSVEVVRYQPAHVECHMSVAPPTVAIVPSTCSDDSDHQVAAAASHCNETQSLMANASSRESRQVAVENMR